MKLELVKKLEMKAEEVAKTFSNENRALNNNSENFEVQSIRPLSDTVALVSYKKSSGKFALALFLYINSSYNNWTYCFPTDSHFWGLHNFLKSDNYLITMNANLKRDRIKNAKN